MYNLLNPFIKLKFLATIIFCLENSNLFGIDLVYPIPILYQYLRLIFGLFDFLEHPYFHRQVPGYNLLHYLHIQKPEHNFLYYLQCVSKQKEEVKCRYSTCK